MNNELIVRKMYPIQNRYYDQVRDKYIIQFEFIKYKMKRDVMFIDLDIVCYISVEKDRIKLHTNANSELIFIYISFTWYAFSP